MSIDSIGSIKDHTPNYKLIIPRFDLATWHDYIEENFRNIDALFFNLFGINNYSGSWKQITEYTQGQVLFIGDDLDINGNVTEFSGRLVKVLVDHVTDNSDYFNVFYNLHPEYYELFADASTAQIYAQQAQSYKNETEILKNETSIIKEETNSIKNDTDLIKSDVITKQNEINNTISLFNEDFSEKTEQITQQIEDGRVIIAQETAVSTENVEKSRIWAEGEQAEVEPLGGTLSSMGAADLAYAIANAPEDVPVDASGLKILNVIKGEKGDKGDKGDPGKDGKDGGGLEIGDIAPTVFGIDETKNLRRYLNGQVISQIQFETFTNIIKERAKLYPNIITTEENWQAEVTNSKLGQCGKFVIDDELGTIRLPKVVNINGLQDLALMGSIKAESLPNITGGLKYSTYTAETTGVFSKISGSGSASSATFNNYNTGSVSLDANKSSSTYQDNAPVQQEAIQYPYFIQVATGVEESVDVTREIELNNPFSLLDYKWSEYEITNASWLLSNGAFHSGTVYKSVYELLLKIHNGTETKDGVSVKLSTEAYADTDFVLNTSNSTFRLPIKVKLASGNAVVGNGITLGLTNGIEYASLTSSTPAQSSAYLKAYVTNYGASVGATSQDNPTLTVAKSIGVTEDPEKSGIETSSNGLKLYFYVGETIQDANVINASQVLTDVANLKSYAIGMPDFTTEVSIPLDTWVLLPVDALVYGSGSVSGYQIYQITVSLDGVNDYIHFQQNGQYGGALGYCLPKGVYIKISDTCNKKSAYYPLKGAK